MKVNFLNVGQGDSLVLQWLRDGNEKVGIIDCKNNKLPNSTIEYLKKIKPVRIDFIILSHPHSDHFSGLKDLLTFLVEEKIPVDHFYTTATLSPNRILMSIKGKIARNEVTQLFKMLKDLENTGGLPTYFLNEIGFDMKLNDDWCIKIMSPSKQEFDSYSSNANYNIIKQEEQPENEPRGNLLSTFLAVYNNNSYFLLTSDSVANTFHRIDKKHKMFFNSKKLSLGQIAHHGSKENYKSAFWKNKNGRKNPIPAVISVGQNSYNHPSDSVIENLIKLGYQIYTTEYLTDFKKLTNNIIGLLNPVSTISKLKSSRNKSTSEGVIFDFIGDNAIKM